MLIVYQIWHFALSSLCTALQSSSSVTWFCGHWMNLYLSRIKKRHGHWRRIEIHPTVSPSPASKQWQNSTQTMTTGVGFALALGKAPGAQHPLLFTLQIRGSPTSWARPNNVFKAEIGHATTNFTMLYFEFGHTRSVDHVLINAHTYRLPSLVSLERDMTIQRLIQNKSDQKQLEK